MKFTHWKVAGKKATHVNPYDNCVGDPAWLFWKEFNEFAQANTLDTSLPDGEYKVEDVEEVWQYRRPKSDTWVKDDDSFYDYDSFQDYSDNIQWGFTTRKALVLKEPKKFSGEINNENFKSFMEKRAPHDGSDEGECNAFTKLKEEPVKPETIETTEGATYNPKSFFNQRVDPDSLKVEVKPETPKPETVEEAAEIYRTQNFGDDSILQVWDKEMDEAIVFGANWQASQSNLISRDKVIEAIQKRECNKFYKKDIISLIKEL